MIKICYFLPDINYGPGLDFSRTIILIWKKITLFYDYNSKSVVVSGSRFLEDHNFNLAKNNIFCHYKCESIVIHKWV